MLETDENEIKLMVGLAGSASADDASADSTGCIDSTPDLCGHCFAVLRHWGCEGQPCVRLLEGTTNMRVYPDQQDGPQNTCKIIRNGEPNVIKFQMNKFLNMLCQTASEMTRVTNVSIDQRAAPGPRGAVPNGSIRGLTRPNIVSQCLHTQRADMESTFGLIRHVAPRGATWHHVAPHDGCRETCRCPGRARFVMLQYYIVIS